MTLSRRVRANRANARRSTGPKTAAGKSKAAGNARRHGLSVPVNLEASLEPMVEEFALVIAGEGADATRFDKARRVAEAQIDLLRIRRSRLAILSNPAERSPRRIGIRALRRWIKAAKFHHRVDTWTYKRRLKASAEGSWERFQLDCDVEEAFSDMQGLFEGRLPDFATPSLEGGFPILARKLVRVDRYERRALVALYRHARLRR